MKFTHKKELVSHSNLKGKDRVCYSISLRNKENKTQHTNNFVFQWLINYIKLNLLIENVHVQELLKNLKYQQYIVVKP